MKTVKEVALLTGVSVRTLHHYDAIGLLKPTRVTEAGYRLYDDGALGRLQTILLLRELQFPLKQIKTILESPEFDPEAALEQQIAMLELQRQRLDALIAHARQIQKTGGINMDFSAFDKTELNAYAAEAKKKWGGTDAYRECQQKTAGQTKAAQKADAEALMAVFTRFGAIRGTDPGGPQAQALAAELQRFITDHYYTCTPQILRSLGQMYTADERMKQNIDAAGGSGTAEFVQKVLEIYCG